MVVGRSPHGERGLKSERHVTVGWRVGRSPHGERGLKCPCDECVTFGTGSLSSRRAWIEISWSGRRPVLGTRRSPHGERGLKSFGRGKLRHRRYVALLTESVD